MYEKLSDVDRVFGFRDASICLKIFTKIELPLELNYEENRAEKKNIFY